jgi:hypothetical protein
MALDIDNVLKDWEHEPGEVVVRRVRAADGRTVLQMRQDLGVLQMELEGRPDGKRPHDYDSYFAYLRSLADEHPGEPFFLDEAQCKEADREFLQYYHRRICWLALKEYQRAVDDADHNLAFMDFVKEHSPSEQFTLAHEQYRCFVMYHRTQAAVALALEDDRPEEALDILSDAVDYIERFFGEHGLAEHLDEDLFVRQLRELDQQVRRRYGVETTLREQLQQAVANEQYELAARLRDKMRKRHPDD